MHHRLTYPTIKVNRPSYNYFQEDNKNGHLLCINDELQSPQTIPETKSDARESFQSHVGNLLTPNTRNSYHFEILNKKRICLHGPLIYMSNKLYGMWNNEEMAKSTWNFTLLYKDLWTCTLATFQITILVSKGGLLSK